MVDEAYMNMAIELAKAAADMGEVPIGAVVVRDGEVIGRGFNKKEATTRASDHAEMIAIAEANDVLNSWRLSGCTLYVTLEPCPMCAGAIQQSRIDRVVFGAFDRKNGALGSILDLYAFDGFNHYPEVVGGVLETECAELLSQFFRELREQKKIRRSGESI
ncbi:MAG: tRNA adenosine(34) deaminase TadA [Bacillota bacterium]|nr:tRNA adenosine(34) deaminase TadA [Bacillota bacterium]